MATSTQSTAAYCPHCHLLVARDVVEPWPPQPSRCPHCQLLIGTGRSRPEPSGDAGAKGTAAGVFSRQAKRDDGAVGSAPETVLAAIRQVAADLGERPERLLMVDYQQRAATEPEIPPLRDVFASFGSWKRARRQAADKTPSSS